MVAVAWDPNGGESNLLENAAANIEIRLQRLSPQTGQADLGAGGLNLRFAIRIFKFRDRSFKLRGQNRELFL